MAQQKGTLWIGINLNQAVTIVWRTKPGTMLSIGLKLQHHCLDGLLPLPVASSRMPQARGKQSSSFVWSRNRGILALQKLPLADKGIGLASFAFSWI
jgi:hypothetical protein